MNSNEQAKEIVDIWYMTHDAKASASDRRALVDEIAKALDATRTDIKARCLGIARHAEGNSLITDDAGITARDIADEIEALP